MYNREYNELVWSLWHGAKKSTGGWRRANCPVCIFEGHGKEDRRLSLGIHEEGYWKCFRCETRGFLKELGGELYEDRVPNDIVRKTDTSIELDNGIPLPREYIPLWEEPGLSATLTQQGREYLLNERGFNKNHWRAAKIGYCPHGMYEGRVVVPVYDKYKIGTVGFAARLCSKHQEGERKTLFPQGMGTGEILYEEQLLYRRTNDPVFIMEGVFDVLPYHGKACCTFGKPTEAQYRLLLKAKRPVVLVFDSDTNNLSQGIRDRLKFEGKKALSIDLPNGKDPDEIDPNWLLTKANDLLKET